MISRELTKEYKEGRKSLVVWGAQNSKKERRFRVTLLGSGEDCQIPQALNMQLVELHIFILNQMAFIDNVVLT